MKVVDGFLSNWLELMMHEGKPISRRIQKNCPKCYLSWEEFRKNGKVGCAECYTAFQPEILSAIQQIQGTSSHIKKMPKKEIAELQKQKKINELKKAQQLAIRQEDFEQAALLRDQIRKMENEAGERDED